MKKKKKFDHETSTMVVGALLFCIGTLFLCVISFGPFGTIPIVVIMYLGLMYYLVGSS